MNLLILVLTYAILVASVNSMFLDVRATTLCSSNSPMSQLQRALFCGNSFMTRHSSPFLVGRGIVDPFGSVIVPLFAKREQNRSLRQRQHRRHPQVHQYQNGMIGLTTNKKRSQKLTVIKIEDDPFEHEHGAGKTRIYIPVDLDFDEEEKFHNKKESCNGGRNQEPQKYRKVYEREHQSDHHDLLFVPNHYFDDSQQNNEKHESFGGNKQTLSDEEKEELTRLYWWTKNRDKKNIEPIKNQQHRFNNPDLNQNKEIEFESRKLSTNKRLDAS